MNRLERYRGKHVIILGLGKSGVSAASLFYRFGAHVTVNDKRERDNCPEASVLEAMGICVICGCHPDDLIDEHVALVVKNPGIPYSISPIMRAIALGIEVVTEVEIAYWLSPAPIIAITGSNGKTTTTTWVGKMLEAIGMRPIVAGNIGIPLCQVIQEVDANHTLVVELSSFQLKGTSLFLPRIGCLLNITATHLDYHGTMEDYINCKARLFTNMSDKDIAVLNADDKTCERLAPSIQADQRWFSSMRRLERGVFVEPPYVEKLGNVERMIVYADGSGTIIPIVHVAELGIPGKYNVDNALAACAIAITAGAVPSALAKTLQSFAGVEHRLEFVREQDGVKYYNNSKATNVKATLVALEAFADNIILIAGGLDRGLDFHGLIPIIRERVKAIVAMGQTRHRIKNVAEQAGLTNIFIVNNVDNAADAVKEVVTLAKTYASSGDTVLLSPACPSWDMFPSYEDRGRMFKAVVHSL